MPLRPKPGRSTAIPPPSSSGPEPVERRRRQAVEVEDRRGVAAPADPVSPARRRKTGCSSSWIVSSVTGGTPAEDSLSACEPSASARPSSTSSASVPSPRSPRPTRSSPHQGGVSANVAVTAARAGASVALAGGAGDDAWGAWLHDRLEAERRRPRVVPPRGRAAHGARLRHRRRARRADLRAARRRHRRDDLGAQAAGCSTRSRRPTRCSSARTSSPARPRRRSPTTARERALELGRPFVFDANIRLRALGRQQRPAPGPRAASACPARSS